MKKSEKTRRKFTDQEKLKILGEAKKNGVKATLEKYDLFPATFYYWKRKYIVYGEEGLAHRKSSENEALIKKLEKENEALKILLAERELESKLKDELLKKKYPELRKKL